MNRMAGFILGVILLLTPTCFGIDWETYDEDKFDSFVFDDIAEARFFNSNSSSGQFVTFNATLLLFSGGVLLSSIAGAVLLYYLLTVPPKAGFDYDYGGGYGESEQGYSRQSNGRSFNPYGIDWERFSVLDWIAVAEETWKNFDPVNLDCQKRFICEIHQNTLRFGYVARKLVDIFSYLQYAEVFRLPDELKIMIDDYLDAANKGRSFKKDCGEIYNGCDFSVKRMFDKVSHNEI